MDNQLTQFDKTVRTLLWLVTGLLWEPRLDPRGRAYMWLRPADSAEPSR